MLRRKSLRHSSDVEEKISLISTPYRPQGFGGCPQVLLREARCIQCEPLPEAKKIAIERITKEGITHKNTYCYIDRKHHTNSDSREPYKACTGYAIIDDIAAHCQTTQMRVKFGDQLPPDYLLYKIKTK